MKRTFMKQVMSLVLSALLVLGVVVITPNNTNEVLAATNIVTNGDFETGTLATGYSGATVVTSPVYSGSYAAQVNIGEKLQFTTDSVNGGELLNADATYLMTAYVYSEEANTINLFVPTWDVNWENAQVDNVSKDFEIEAGVWTKIEYEIPVKTYLSLAQPRISSSAGIPFYIDEICISEHIAEITFHLSSVTTDGHWYFVAESMPEGSAAEGYIYNCPVLVDGEPAQIHVSISETQIATYNWDFFNSDKSANINPPTGSLKITAGTILQGIAGTGKSLVVAKDLEVTVQDGVWVETKEYDDITLSFFDASNDNWVLPAQIGEATLTTYYVGTVLIDGEEREIPFEWNGTDFVVWSNFFSMIDAGSVPTKTMEVKAGTVLKPVNPDVSGWQTETVGNRLTITNDLFVLKGTESWATHTHDRIQYGEVEGTCKVAAVVAGEKCSGCDLIYVEPVVGELNPENHVNVVEVPAVDATCTEDGGKAGTKCTDCGEILSGCEVIKAQGHDSNAIIPKVDGENGKAGKTAGKKCSVCGKIMVPQKTVSAPKASDLKSVKAGKKKITVKWKKVSGVTGYEIQTATNKKFSKNVKLTTVKKASKVSATVNRLKSKKTYYVRVRAYKITSGVKVYSKWSKKTLKVKVK